MALNSVIAGKSSVQEISVAKTEVGGQAVTVIYIQ